MRRLHGDKSSGVLLHWRWRRSMRSCTFRLWIRRSLAKRTGHFPSMMPHSASQRRILRRSYPAIGEKLPFGRLWYGEPISNAIGYAKFFSRSHDAVIRVYDEAGNVIDTHEHKGDKTLYHIYFFRNFIGRNCAGREGC